MTFQETSAALDVALKELESKKKALDAASAKINQAQADYASAMAKAQDLRMQLVNALEQVMPPMPTNVRVSGGGR